MNPRIAIIGGGTEIHILELGDIGSVLVGSNSSDLMAEAHKLAFDPKPMNVLALQSYDPPKAVEPESFGQFKKRSYRDTLPWTPKQKR